MCGRYALRTSVPRLAAMLGVEPLRIGAGCGAFEGSYNIAPTHSVPICRGGPSGRTLDSLRWGLVPRWSKDAKPKYSMINARAETLLSRSAYREPFQRRRCLVPADGFYEWRRVGKRKQPVLVRLRSEEPFAFAGLWERWRRANEEPIESFTIITTEANDTLAQVHDRMPVILDQHDFSSWLDPELARAEELAPLLRPYRSDAMAVTEVSGFVNQPQNDGPRCWEPILPESGER